MNVAMGTILAFGYHDRNSPRHRTVCEALTRDGGTIIECHTEMKGFFGKCIDLRRKFKTLSATTPQSLLVPFPGHFLVPLAWQLTRKPRKRLIFDAFISLYDTDVLDRRKVSRWNPWAWMLWMIDWVSMHLADEVLIDTQTHRQFLIDTFHLRPESVRVIYLEARADLFFIRKERCHPEPVEGRQHVMVRRAHHDNPNVEIFFYGTLIPLQGVDVILDTAKILQDQHANVHFTMAGSSKLQEMAATRDLKNVTCHPFVPIEDLPAMMHAADLCLGIFGTSNKAQRVIPHKVVDAVACGVPVITEDSPAIRERFADHPLVRLIPAGNPAALARAILALARH